MQIAAPLVSQSCSTCSTAFNSAASGPSQQNKLNQDPSQASEKAEQSSATVLSEAEQKQLQQLKARDREVRVHEAAHLAAAGSLALSGATFSYQRGPDGVQYAVGGEVRIDTSAVPGDPEATLDKAQQIRSAALAPAQPSQQDIAVAAKASQLAIEARIEISQERQSEQNEQSAINASSSIPSDDNDADTINNQNNTNQSLIERFSQTEQTTENLINQFA